MSLLARASAKAASGSLAALEEAYDVASNVCRRHGTRSVFWSRRCAVEALCQRSATSSADCSVRDGYADGCYQVTALALGGRTAQQSEAVHNPVNNPRPTSVQGWRTGMWAHVRTRK